jgi:hypothetical protein
MKIWMGIMEVDTRSGKLGYGQIYIDMYASGNN